MIPFTKHVSPEAEGSAKQAWRRIGWVMLLRVALISVLLGTTLVLNYGMSSAFRSASPVFLLALIAFTYFATIAYAIWYRAGKGIVWLAWTQLAIDALIWGSLAYATGGIASGFTFLFDLWVIVAAVVLGGRAAFILAAMSSIVLVAMSAFMGFGLLPPLSDQLHATLGVRETAYFLGVNVMGLFVVAGLVTSLVGRLERTGKGLERERARRADLAVLHSDIIRSLPVGLATTESGGEILSINPAGRSILSIGEESVDGRSLSRWLPGLRSEFERGQPFDARGHGVCVATGGGKIPVEFTVTPLLGADGSHGGSIVVFNDLTKVKKLEAALEKTRKLAALGELAASLAHEIRNPLSAVSGSFQMLSASPDFNEEDRSLCDIISRELERMERLVNDMLEYARPNEPRRYEVDLGLLVDEVVRAFLHGREADGRSVEVFLQEEILVNADQSQIKQVLWNLLRNASQATDEGGTVEVGVGAMDGAKAVLEVADDGVGIPEANLDRVFDPFYSTRERGLGLGLAICRRIVEGHGGSIEVAPREEGGTIFRVTLPLRQITPEP